MKHLSKSLVTLLAAVVLLAGCTKKSSEKQILSFSFHSPEVEATIMESSKIIVATMPSGTDVTALEPIITVSEKATVNPASGIPQDFTHSKTYIVTAEDGTQAVYTVMVTVEDGGGGETECMIILIPDPEIGGTVSGEGTYPNGESCTIKATPAAGYTFEKWERVVLTSEHVEFEQVSTEATYTFTVTSSGIYYARFVKTGGGGDSHAYVDLGLPSGTLWATCNIGANAPEDYGDYFAWGETTTKDYFDWDNYQYCKGTRNTLTKYCSNASYGYNGFMDDLTTLLPEDDAATANWGGGWRMPTFVEWEELYHNTSLQWKTQNGVEGLLFIAANGNSLFLPAAGYSVFDIVSHAGTDGNYWSSSLDTDLPGFSWGLDFNDYCSVPSYPRGYGRPVRPVRCKNSVITVNANSTAGGTVSGGGSYMDRTTCTLTATANSGYVFVNWTDENNAAVSNKATYTFTVSGNRSLVANFTSEDVHAYVDLGLPSGTLWATCNIGANAPEDYGDYFAWGETETKTTYTWENYIYAEGTSWLDPKLTKYCSVSDYGNNGFTDDLTVLLPEDDAATANWGDDWRMPTQTEWRELLDNTTNIWTTWNGVNGRLFTATNGNTLFLPAAGEWSYEIGESVYYWSSSLQTDKPCYAREYYSSSDYYEMNGSNRQVGCTVRPVRSSAKN